jgi:hypothetical protein
MHPAVSTVMTIRQVTPSAVAADVGFGDANWGPLDGKTIVIARGWHPREHQTYFFVWNEPLPVFQPRWLLIETTGSATEAEFLLSFTHNPFSEDPGVTPINLRGKVPLPEWKTGKKLHLRLNDVRLVSPDGKTTATVCGIIVAQPLPEAELRRLFESRKIELQNNAVQHR